MPRDPYIKVWLLNLILPGRFGRWLTSVAIFGVLYGTFSVVGAFDDDNTGTFSSAAAFFFCVVLAYIVPIYHYINERTEAALRDLRPALKLNDEEFDHIQRRISCKHRNWYIWVSCIGLLAGISHNLLLTRSPENPLASLTASPESATLFLSTNLVWLVMMFAISGLTSNAYIFAQLARRTTIDLLNTATLTPYARVAVSSTLAVIGAQASFPLMLIEGDASPWAFAPGLVATGGPMVLLLLLPVWPIHRAIAAAKHARLAELNRAIAQAPAPNPAEPATLERLNPLLSFRREIHQVSEWPFDVGLTTRLGLYLIIPPLTWVGAALIENLVEALL